MEHLTRSQAAPVVRLDDELADRTEPVQLLKVDTDGYDIDVLRSAEGILMRDQPVLFVEFCPVLMDTDPIADLTWLQGLGYEKLVCLDNLGHHVGTTDDPAQAAAWAAANTYCDILTVATGSAFESKLADVALPRRRRGVVWAARSLFPRRVRPTNADDAEDAEDAAGLAAAFQAQCLARVDLSRHNAADARPTFPNLQSQAASAAQCDTPEYLALAHQLMGWEGDLAGIRYNRKVWEYAYIVQAVAEAGLLRKGAQAVGFGVGSEPIPAYFALHGMDVLATDQGLAGATKEQWTQAGQLLQDLSSLSRPHLLSDDDLAQRVRTRDVDMNGVPDDIGRFDVVWSSCVIEHLGSPERGLDFVLESCGLLNPGGIAVHTTELELTDQPKAQDYGHCAVYRVEDLAALEQRLAEIGCSATFNFDVSMDTFEDRWISLVLHPKHGPHLPDPDGLHLKLLLGESVSTSFGILIRKL
jgi:hypothetical protein